MNALRNLMELFLMQGMHSPCSIRDRSYIFPDEARITSE